MSEYRFIAFPKGVTPTAKEVAAFRGYAEMLNDRVAYGKQRNDAGLAICCQAEPFDRLRGLDPKFASLLKRWEKQGAEVVSSLPFTRDKEPWREISPKKGSPKSKPQKAETAAAPEASKQSEKPARADRPSPATAKPAATVQPPQPSRSKKWLLYAGLVVVAAAGFSTAGYFLGRQSEVDARVLQHLEELERLGSEAENAAIPEEDRGVELSSDGEQVESSVASER